MQFNDRSKLSSKADKDLESDTVKSVNALYKGRELVLYASKSGIFPLKSAQGTRIRIFPPKQIL